MAAPSPQPPNRRARARDQGGDDREPPAVGIFGRLEAEERARGLDRRRRLQAWLPLDSLTAEPGIKTSGTRRGKGGRPVIASVHIADVGAKAAFTIVRKVPAPGSIQGLRNANVAIAAPFSERCCGFRSSDGPRSSCSGTTTPRSIASCPTIRPRPGSGRLARASFASARTELARPSERSSGRAQRRARRAGRPRSHSVGRGRAS